MYEIKKFPYDRNSISTIHYYRYGKNWPIVYILEDGREVYVGQSVNAYHRAKQHMEKPERAKLSRMYIIADDEYNLSATLDIESSLIKYMSADGIYQIQNLNEGLRNSNYYDRERYLAKFQTIWKDLQEIRITRHNLIEIENSDLFKFSPFKALSEDQLLVVKEILTSIKKDSSSSHLVSGDPGTGKTIVACYLMKLLSSKDWSKNMKIGFVVPMTSLRSTLKRVFHKVKGLNSAMIIGPNDVIREKYDLLIVDEAHRLQRRVNITNYRQFDRVNKKLGLNNENGNQLDWIMNSSKYQILFYDQMQSIKPADIRRTDLDKYHFVNYKLESQMRVKGGEDYIKYISNILVGIQDKKHIFPNYDLKLFENIGDMVNEIRKKNKERGLSRILAGYAWEWKSNKDTSITHDFEIEGIKLKWNAVTRDWVSSANALNEVGCIHTIQGYDLNYAGVIIGPEISYNKYKNRLMVDKDKYQDFNGKRSITNPKELDNYIRNIYKTLLTRGILGTYIYVVDKNLREYMRQFFPKVSVC